jgi:FtsP/CotA-like multicopper oxidase with cupredoxin domain
MRRREFILAGATLSAAAALPLRGAEPRRPLHIPRLLDARTLGGQVALTVREGRAEFYPGVASATMGYDGEYLGPTLRFDSGDDVEVAVANRLPRPTTVHWHGLLVPGELDGGPHQEIAPGDTWRPVLRVRQPAATLWYHSHRHHETAAQVWFGLAGMLIVRDAEESALALPSEYGVDDLPVVIQDRLFQRGRLVIPAGMTTAMQGARGDTLLVNGTPDAYVRVPARLVRLRLVNGSNARDYELFFDDGRAFRWIATDGGLLEAPLARRSLRLSPGERAEIVADFSDGRPATLLTGPDDNFPMGGMGMMGRMGGRAAEGSVQAVLAFEVGAREGSSGALPERLAAPAAWDARESVRVRRFHLDMGMMGMGGMGMGMGMGRMRGGMDMFSINGRPFDPARVDERVRLGDTETWEISADMMAHPFHVHGVQFRVIGRGGGPPAPGDEGIKDTVRVGEPVRLLVRFTQPATTAPFMYHCHILEHEDHGMMGQFTVRD